MAWCEDNRVDYLFRLARSERVTAEIAAEIETERVEAEASCKLPRRFRDFTWSTLDSWSRTRRVFGKAERTGGATLCRDIATNPRRPRHGIFMKRSTARAARGRSAYPVR
jgi:hypothetical protein